MSRIGLKVTIGTTEVLVTVPGSSKAQVQSVADSILEQLLGQLSPVSRMFVSTIKVAVVDVDAGGPDVA